MRRDLARAIRKDQTLPAAHGLDVSVAVVLRDRLQLRLRGNARRDAYDVQLRAGLRPTRRPAARRRAGRVERVLPGRRSPLPHVLDLPARPRSVAQHLQLARSYAARPSGRSRNHALAQLPRWIMTQ